MRYLFGPVTPECASNLRPSRQAGTCRAFGAAGTDLDVGPADTWEEVCGRLPAGWQPDFVVLHLGGAGVAPGLWEAPVPLVGLAGDCDLSWHSQRLVLPRCDLVVSDAMSVETLTRAGITHALPANLDGWDAALPAPPESDRPRDIDVLFTGDLHAARRRQDLPWVARLANLADRWNVVVQATASGATLRELLSRTRIVFIRSTPGEGNALALAAAAAGCLLFQESGNREMPDCLRAGDTCVGCDSDNLENLLRHYLETEEQRRAVAEAARAKVVPYCFDRLWGEVLEGIERAWPSLLERSRRRPRPSAPEALFARTWQALASGGADRNLVRDLEAALASTPSAALHNALGMAVALTVPAGDLARAAAAAADHFRRALECDRNHVAAGLNLAEALAVAGQSQAAAEQARQTLAVLDGLSCLKADVRDAAHFPPRLDFFRVEWERAAWEHAGNPPGEDRAKRRLLSWRLHGLLAKETGLLHHRYEAALARPDLPATRATLGSALLQQGCTAEAVPHLRQAVEGNPFDRAAPRALFDALSTLGRTEELGRLVYQRRLLSRAAPVLVPPEPWFADDPTSGLASLIVLCGNTAGSPQPCLESVLRHTRAPYELIVIDNGSRAGTADYLEGLRRLPGPARVEIIRNEHNLGFARGCTQGLAAARGRHVVFLDGDTVVTPGWLDRLVAWSTRDWPRVGLVGAVSNGAAPQRVEAGYRDLAGLDAFALRQAREYCGKALDCPWLASSCLLARREVLEQVGCFDERSGGELFADGALCERVRTAGFRLLAALDVYVHHFDNPAAPSPRSEEEEHPSVRRLPTLPPGPLTTLCMIVRDEEKNLGECLRAAADLVDEIVIVDTGSTDRTREIAAPFGARVFDFPWVDSFAAARNEGLRHATGAWLFWLDADDRLDEDNRQKLRALLGGLGDENAVYLMRSRSAPDAVTGSELMVDHARLFRNRPDVRWEYRVHEQLLPSALRAGAVVRPTAIVIRHEGYRDPALRRRKLERNLRLLGLDLAERPDDALVLFNLATLHLDFGRTAEAVTLLRRSRERSLPGYSLTPKIYALLTHALHQLGSRAEALTTCREGRQRFPDDAELLFHEGILLREEGDRAGAEASLRQLLRRPPHSALNCADSGMGGYKTRHTLALLCREQGRDAEAEAEWRAAVVERPDFVPGWLGLAELYLAQGRAAYLEQALVELERTAETASVAAIVRARVCLERKDFATACGLLEREIADRPHALWPRVLLGHVLFAEGKDPAATAAALRAVLALDPNQAQARRQLAQVLCQQNAVVTT